MSSLFFMIVVCKLQTLPQGTGFLYTHAHTSDQDGITNVILKCLLGVSLDGYDQSAVCLGQVMYQI